MSVISFMLALGFAVVGGIIGGYALGYDAGRRDEWHLRNDKES